MFDYIRSLPEAYDEVYDLEMNRPRTARLEKIPYPWNCQQCLKRHSPSTGMALYEGTTTLGILCVEHDTPEGFQKEISHDRQEHRGSSAGDSKDDSVH